MQQILEGHFRRLLRSQGFLGFTLCWFNIEINLWSISLIPSGCLWNVIGYPPTTPASGLLLHWFGILLIRNVKKLLIMGQRFEKQSGDSFPGIRLQRLWGKIPF